MVMETYSLIAVMGGLRIKLYDGLTKEQAKHKADSEKRKDLDKCITGWKYKVIKTSDDDSQIEMDI